MPSEPISGLTSGNPAQAGDLIPIARSGANFSLSAASVAALGGGGAGVLGKWAGNIVGSNAAGYAGAGGSTTAGGNQGMDLQQVTGQPQSVQAPTAATPRGIQVQAPGLTAATGLIDLSQNLTPGLVEDWLMSAAIVGTTSSRYFLGFTDCAQGSVGTVIFSDTPNANFIGFRWSSGTDVNLKAVCCTSSGNITVVDTGISTVTARHTFEIVPQSGGSSIAFYIDGGLVATISTHVPANATAMASILTVDGKNSGTTTFNVNFYYVFAVLGL